MSLVDDAKKISPGWWGAIAGGMVAGASLFPESRLVAGVGFGAAMFLLARKLTKPCCASCADAQPQVQQAQLKTEDASMDPSSFFAKVTQPLTTASDCVGCGALS